MRPKFGRFIDVAFWMIIAGFIFALVLTLLPGLLAETVSITG